MNEATTNSEARPNEAVYAADTAADYADTAAYDHGEGPTVVTRAAAEVTRFESTESADLPHDDVKDTSVNASFSGRGAMLHMRRVRSAAEETSRLYPEFDLKREMRDPLFLKLTVATGGDTTAAYVARHYAEIISGRVRDAEKRGAEAVAASVKSGMSRPTEGVMDKGGAILTTRDPAKLSLGDFKRIRESFRKTGKRERF